jgi:hypothetical protein
VLSTDKCGNGLPCTCTRKHKDYHFDQPRPTGNFALSRHRKPLRNLFKDVIGLLWETDTGPVVGCAWRASSSGLWDQGSAPTAMQPGTLGRTPACAAPEPLLAETSGGTPEGVSPTVMPQGTPGGIPGCVYTRLCSFRVINSVLRRHVANPSLPGTCKELLHLHYNIGKPSIH